MPGHHHLGLALRDAPAHLVEHGARRARAGAAAHLGDDAVRAVAVAAVLHLHEAAGARRRQRLRARARRSRRRRSPAPRRPRPRPRRRPPCRPAPSPAGAISSNCAAFRLAAQPVTTTRRPARPFAERRTDWRDFASASRVMQHVLTTCRSASSSGASTCPASSSRVRASIASACETLQPRNLVWKVVTDRQYRRR